MDVNDIPIRCLSLSHSHISDLCHYICYVSSYHLIFYGCGMCFAVKKLLTQQFTIIRFAWASATRISWEKPYRKKKKNLCGIALSQKGASLFIYHYSQERYSSGLHQLLWWM